MPKDFVAVFFFGAALTFMLLGLSSIVRANEPDHREADAVVVTLDQRGVLAADRENKVIRGGSRYEPTGVYKQWDEPLIITVGEHDQTVQPRVVIAKVVVSTPTDGNLDGLPLRVGKNVIDVPEEGVVYVINESEKTDRPPIVTIEGGARFAYFVLGQHNNDDWHRMISEYAHMPVIELVSRRAIVTAAFDTAKHIADPQRLLQYIDEAIAVEDRVSGFDAADDNPIHHPSAFRQHMREHNRPDKFMYMQLNHTAYRSDAFKRLLDPDYFIIEGWGPWHEFGHTYQQNPWTWSGTGEVTVNVYSLNVEQHFGNTSKLEREGHYDTAFLFMRQPQRNYQTFDNVFAKLVMFWQLQLAFGTDFYPRLHRMYRELPKQSVPTTDHDKIQTFIYMASVVAEYNLAPFFDMWGLSPGDSTREAMAVLPVLDEPIWWLTDSGLARPPLVIRDKAAIHAMADLSGAVVTDETVIVIEGIGLDVTSVVVSLNDTVVHRGDSLPVHLTLPVHELAQGVHRVAVTAVDADGGETRHATHFTTSHIQLGKSWEKHGGEALPTVSGEVFVDVVPTVAAEHLATTRLELVRVGDAAGDDVAPAALLQQVEQLPARLVINSLAHDDGTYDIVVETETTAGIVSRFAERIVIRNWRTLEDAMLPPKDLGWLGTVDALKTVDKSAGWHHETGARDEFFDDNDRLTATGADPRYLTWKHEDLYCYEFVMYANGIDVANVVHVDASADGNIWHRQSYRVTVDAQADSGWQKVRVHGVIAHEGPAHLLRLTVTSTDDASALLQLGHVRLHSLIDGSDAHKLPNNSH